MSWRSATILLALGMESMPPAMAQDATACLNRIQAMRDAVDCQNTAGYRNVTWHDGYTEFADGRRSSFLEARLNGPCPKYRTFHREIRTSFPSANTQIVRLKSISTRVAFDGRYSGDYTVSNMEYVCERRDGRWGIFSQTWLSRNDLVNENAAADFRRSGGYDRDLETEY